MVRTPKSENAKLPERNVQTVISIFNLCELIGMISESVESFLDDELIGLINKVRSRTLKSSLYGVEI